MEIVGSIEKSQELNDNQKSQYPEEIEKCLNKMKIEEIDVIGEFNFLSPELAQEMERFREIAVNCEKNSEKTLESDSPQLTYEELLELNPYQVHEIMRSTNSNLITEEFLNEYKYQFFHFEGLSNFGFVELKKSFDFCISKEDLEKEYKDMLTNFGDFFHLVGFGLGEYMIYSAFVEMYEKNDEFKKIVDEYVVQEPSNDLSEVTFLFKEGEIVKIECSELDKPSLNNESTSQSKQCDVRKFYKLMKTREMKVKSVEEQILLSRQRLPGNEMIEKLHNGKFSIPSFRYIGTEIHSHKKTDKITRKIIHLENYNIQITVDKDESNNPHNTTKFIQIENFVDVSSIKCPDKECNILLTNDGMIISERYMSKGIHLSIIRNKDNGEIVFRDFTRPIDNSSKGLDNSSKGLDNSSKGLDNSSKGLEKSNLTNTETYIHLGEENYDYYKELFKLENQEIIVTKSVCHSNDYFYFTENNVIVSNILKFGSLSVKLLDKNFVIEKFEDIDHQTKYIVEDCYSFDSCQEFDDDIKLEIAQIFFHFQVPDNGKIFDKREDFFKLFDLTLELKRKVLEKRKENGICK